MGICSISSGGVAFSILALICSTQIGVQFGYNPLNRYPPVPFQNLAYLLGEGIKLLLFRSAIVLLTVLSSKRQFHPLV